MKIVSNIYYQLNKKSFFYPFMQDTTVEDLLTEEEKRKKYNEIIAKISFCEMEGEETNLDEKNYLIYAVLNNVSKEVIQKNILNWIAKNEE